MSFVLRAKRVSGSGEGDVMIARCSECRIAVMRCAMGQNKRKFLKKSNELEFFSNSGGYLQTFACNSLQHQNQQEELKTGGRYSR